MIEICLNTDEFEYDVRAMVKAFYPEEFLYVQCKESKVQSQKPPGDECVKMHMNLDVKDEEIDLRLQQGEEITCEKAHTVKGDRSQRKNDLKRLLYHVFSMKTGRTLPWGTLTGIRPTKMIMKDLEDGKEPSMIMQEMKEKYLVSDEKLMEGVEIAGREREILKKLPEQDGYSLYVHIPFCPTTCLYCSFTSFSAKRWKDAMDDYVDAVIKELSVILPYDRKKKLTTVYFGGGTPTTLSSAQLRRLIQYIKEQFDLSDLLEFTVEAGRPDSITKEKLQVLKELGVTRISINPQTMKEETLHILGRNHTVNDVVNAFHLARQCGFDNINMDIILGLPMEDSKDNQMTLQEIQKLHPDNLTVHCLARKHNARLNLEKEKYKDLTFADVTEGMELSSQAAKDMGMVPYYMYRQKNIAGNQENIGYARENKFGIYNILIMEERQSILAVGAGAITKLVGKPGEFLERVENVKDVATYLERVDEMMERKKRAFESYGLI
ncbi:MAG: coproporphyrinogen dehydrogenase HemZ [Lachnospiraceae bacterium]|nr:coproporphyrinogen dehydrogenase HemZ [Lachnospiraceae bacterium]